MVLAPYQPWLRFLPAGPNLLAKTEQFDDAAWAKFQATVAANATTAPDGTATADKVVEAAVSGNHGVSQTATGAGLGPKCGSVFAKAAERSQVHVFLNDGAVFAQAIVNLATGAVVTLFSGAVAVQDAGDGWWRIAVQGIGATGANVGLNVRPAVAGNPNYAGDGASGIYVWGAQLVRGVAPAPYQRVG